MRIITQDTTQWVNASLEISFSVFWLCLVFLPSFQPLASWVCCAWQSWKNSCLHWNWQCCSSSSVSYHQNQTLCSKSKRQTQSVSRINCFNKPKTMTCIQKKLVMMASWNVIHEHMTTSETCIRHSWPYHIQLALFPGPAQLSITCNMDKCARRAWEQG